MDNEKKPGLDGQTARFLSCPHCGQAVSPPAKTAPFPTLAQAEGTEDATGAPIQANPWSTRKNRQQAEARELLRPKGK